MKAPIEWLRNLVEIKSEPEELAKKLSLISIGVDKVDYQGREPILDIDVTYNRGDLLSMIGLAYEIAFIEESRLKLPKLTTDIAKLADLNDWQIKREEESCPLYVAVLLEINPVDSPDWIKRRLGLINSQSKGNIVDIANYVMWEYGQPFHTFDADKLKSQDIRIQKSGRSLEFTTLDGQERRLNADDILIFSGQEPIALAGIMGGQETEITSQTKNVLLEMALFNPYQIRKTAMRYGLFSDAANHFIHKPSPNTSMLALARILDLYQKYGRARIKGIKISGRSKVANPQIQLRTQDISRLIGLEIKSQDIERILTSLHFTLQAKKKNIWSVQAPHWRSDIKIKEDVIEEVIRGYGYWRLESVPLPIEFIKQEEAVNYNQDVQLKNFLTGQGLYQINNYGFLNQEEIKTFGLKTAKLIKVTNPISAEAEFLRTSLITGLSLYLGQNQLKSLPLTKPIGVFELNNAYNPEYPDNQQEKLAIGTYERSDLNRLLNNLIRYLHLDWSKFEIKKGSTLSLAGTKKISDVYQLIYAGRPLATLAKALDFWLVEFDYQRLLIEADFQPRPSRESKFNPIIEDLTFELNSTYQLMLEVLFQIAKLDQRLKDILVLGEYKNRLTLRLAYLSSEKQLSSSQAAQIRRKVVSLAEKKGLKLIGEIPAKRSLAQTNHNNQISKKS